MQHLSPRVLEVPSFPKIFHYGESRIANLIREGRVEVTEKIDGSLFAFGININGELVMRSKGQPVGRETLGMFGPVVRAVVLEREAAIKDALPPGSFVYGETLQKPKHNTLAYGRVPEGNFIMFGCFNAGILAPNGWLDHDDLMLLGRELNFEVVPLIAAHYPTPIEMDQMLERESILGKEKIEGVVIRNLDNVVAFFPQDQPAPVLCKYVRSDFRERNSKEWAGVNDSTQNKFQALFETYRTEPRWRKAIQHLQEAGQLQGRMQDMPLLVDELKRDLTEECKEEIKEAFWLLAQKDLYKTVGRGLAEFYKQTITQQELDSLAQLEILAQGVCQ